MANFYISDTHFGTVNNFDNRTLEHDELIKKNWNSVVTNGDTVYILGDVGRFGGNNDNEKVIQLVATLRGQKVLVSGNHDRINDKRFSQLFKTICDHYELIDNFKGKSCPIVLSHYPILMWNKQHKGAILLYGHTHNSVEDEIYQKSIESLNHYFANETAGGRTDCPQAIAINVGCMKPYMDWTPRRLEELLASRGRKNED